MALKFSVYFSFRLPHVDVRGETSIGVLEEQLRWARPTLRRKTQHYKHHQAANTAGKKAGEELIIKRAVSSGSKDLYYVT